MVTIKMASIVVNVVDLEQVADFWKRFLGVGERHRTSGFVWLERQPTATVSLAFQQVDVPTEGRNRLHIDFGVSDADEVRSLILELGGRELETHDMDDFSWTVFADPEGNEFCIAQADPDDYT